MDEFLNLNWSWRACSSDVDLKQSYHLDLGESVKANPANGFHSNLLQIDTTHLVEHYQQRANDRDSVTETEKPQLAKITEHRRFIDPRTQIALSTHTINSADVDLASRNILLSKQVEISKLTAAEQKACLQVILKLKSVDAELSTDDKANRSIYTATIRKRLDEKTRFLAFLKQNYFDQLSHRYHAEQPPVDAFITQKWKRQLLELFAETADDAYRLSSALKIERQTRNKITAELIHQEHYGQVPEMLGEPRILKQSCANLIRAYQRSRNKQFCRSMQTKSNEIVETMQVNVIMPLSVMKLFVLDDYLNWSVSIEVKDVTSCSLVNLSKTISFKKPMPPLYLSGHDRRTIGNKYILRSMTNHTSTYCHSTQNFSETETCANESIDGTAHNDQPYKLVEVENSVGKDSTTIANRSFRIWNLSDGNDTIRLMIPSKTDAVRRCQGDNRIEMLNLSSKDECQAEYGAEMMTKTELLKEWCRQYFLPDSTTLRFRCASDSGQVIKLETLHLDEIEINLKNLYGIERKTLLNNLWNSIRTFLNFPVGDFLLRHNMTDPGLIKIYQKCEKSDASTSIAAIYEKVSFDKSSLDKIEWHPIDDQLITDIHLKTNLLPCAFPPASYYGNVEIDSSASTASASNKKNKFKPRDDSGWVTKRMETRQTTLSKVQELKQNQKAQQNRERRIKYRQRKKLKKS